MAREPAQHAFARWPYTHDHLTPIAPVSAPLDHPAFDKAINQLNHGVMLDLQTLREHPDGCHVAPFEALDLQEDQVLLRLYTGRARGRFAYAQEPPQPIAQIRQRPVVEAGGSGVRGSLPHFRECITL